MNFNTRRLPARLTAACITALVASVTSVALASPSWAESTAAPADTTPAVQAALTGPVLYFSDYGDGYNGVINGQAANKILLATPAGTVAVFSLNPDVDYVVDSSAPYSPVEVADEAARAAAYIAVNAPSLGSALEDPKLEAVATQLAIWKLSAGMDYSSVDNSSAKKRADELVALAQPLAAPPVTYSATAAWASPTDVDVTVTVGEFPLPGVPVTLAEASKVTDENGIAPFADAVGIPEATVSPTLPAGTILAVEGGTLTVTTAAVVAPFSLPVPEAPISTVEETPTPEPTEGAPADGDGVTEAETSGSTPPDKNSLNNEPVDKLPWTGSSTPAWLPLALLAFAAAALVAGRKVLKG